MSFTVPFPIELPRELRCAREQCESSNNQALSLAHWLDGQVGDALKHGRRALARHHTGCPPNHSALWVAVMLTAVREYDRALTVLDPTTPHASGGNALHDLARHVVAARAELDGGCPGAELDRLRRALRGHEGELPEFWRFYVNLLFADVALRGLDLTALADHARRITEDSVLASLNVSPFGRTSWAVIRKKDVELGREAVLPLMDRLAHAGAPCRRLLMSEPTAGAWLVRAFMQAGNYDSARSVLSNAHQVASTAPDILSLQAGAMHAQGLFDLDADKLRRAVSLHHGRLAVATATEDLAMTVAVRDDSSDEAPALLKEALAGYEAAKSPQDVARVKQRLRELGHALHHPPTVGTQGVLSRAERSVADLVAQGLTNVQVAELLSVSQHTVASHLRTIFRKLGLKSRVELARNWTGYRSIHHEPACLPSAANEKSSHSGAYLARVTRWGGH